MGGKSHAREFEKLSLELSRKHSEALKMCSKSNHRCTQLEESIRRLERSDEHHKGTVPSETSHHEKIESPLAPERKTWQELSSKSNHRCTQLEESIQRLERIDEHHEETGGVFQLIHHRSPG